MLSQKRDLERDLELEEKIKLKKPKFESASRVVYPSWFTSEHSFFLYKDQEFSATSFWLQWGNLSQSTSFALFHFFNQPYLVLDSNNQEDIDFIPVNHQETLTLGHRASTLPPYPVALSKGILAEQATSLYQQLQVWFPGPPGSDLSEGFEVVHPWDSSRSLWIQVQPSLVLFWVTALTLLPAYTHFQWHWVQTKDQKAAIVTHGIQTVEGFQASSNQTGWLCLVPWPQDLTQKFDGRFLLPVGYLQSSYVPSDFKFVRSFNRVNNPCGLVVYQERLYVADSGYHRIQVFDLEGQQVWTWGSRGSGLGEFIRPHDLAIYQDLVYVVDRGNNRIQVFTLKGEFVRQWGSKGDDNGSIQNADTIKVGEVKGQIRVFVAEAIRERINVFDEEGVFLTFWSSQVSSPRGLIFTQGLLFVLSYFDDTIAVFRPDGTYLYQFGNDQVLNANFGTVYQDEIFIAHQNQISVFNLQGKLQYSRPTKTRNPAGIAIAANRIFVADLQTNEIKVFQ